MHLAGRQQWSFLSWDDLCGVIVSSHAQTMRCLVEIRSAHRIQESLSSNSTSQVHIIRNRKSQHYQCCQRTSSSSIVFVRISNARASIASCALHNLNEVLLRDFFQQVKCVRIVRVEKKIQSSRFIVCAVLWIVNKKKRMANLLLAC